MKKILIAIFVLLLALGIYLYNNRSAQEKLKKLTDVPNLQNDDGGLREDLNPLTIESLRNGEYPGSNIVIEQTLDPGSNYDRYIASYRSEGLKIYALLTVPQGDKPSSGWPAIV